jgi:hypothetical protein
MALPNRQTITEYVDNRLVDQVWDDIAFEYTGSDLTQVRLYYQGELVKTVNLTWANSLVTDVESIYKDGRINVVHISYSGVNISGVERTLTQE